MRLGDFDTDPVSGRLTRRVSPDGAAEFVFAGIQLSAPALFACVDVSLVGQAFSTNVAWDRALAAGRLFGLVHAGGWLHVGDPRAYAAADNALREPLALKDSEITSLVVSGASGP